MKLILLIASVLFLSGACEKEHLPEFYFKCKVDGKEYVPDNCANCVISEILRDTVLILGGNKGFETLGVGINDTRGIQTGNYILNEVVGRRGDYKFATTPIDRYFTNNTHNGNLSITTFDKINKIIAGTFYFTAYNAVQNKTVKITDGKFRLQYKTN